jgi:hypothetical protein
MSDVAPARPSEDRQLDDRDLMEIRADTLFRHDLRGRMVCVNDPEGRPAPRLFLGQTGVAASFASAQVWPMRWHARAWSCSGLIRPGGERYYAT